VKSKFQCQVVEALQPPATALSDDILFWMPITNAPVVYYIRFFDELACKVNVESAHDPRLVQSFLGELPLEQLHAVKRDHPLGLFVSRSLAATAFHLRAVVHPSISRGAPSKTTAFMADRTYTTFPVYRCEFTNDDTPEETAFRMAKVVRWSSWSRAPAAALSARFHRTRTGIKSTGGKRMGIYPLTDIERIISYLGADDGFIEIENYERRLVRLEHGNRRYEVTQGNEKWIPRADGVIPWLRVFAIEGLEAANKARQTYVA
jgi:hypothetical protein